MSGIPDLTPLDAEIGTRARAYRVEKQISQEQVAAHLNLSVPQISQLENGKRAWAVKYIYALAKFYDVDPVTFMGGIKASPADQALFEAIKQRINVESEIGAKTKSGSRGKKP